MRRFEYGEDICSSCQAFYIGEPGPNHGCFEHCAECQAAIDAFWDRVYAAQKESGEEMDEDTMMFAGICALMAPAFKEKK